MKKLTTYLFIIITLLNLALWKAASWLSTEFRQTLPDSDMSFSMLSVWAGRAPVIFLLLAAISLFCIISTVQNRKSDRALLITGVILLIAGILTLLVAAFGYSILFISYCPGIE